MSQLGSLEIANLNIQAFWWQFNKQGCNQLLCFHWLICQCFLVHILSKENQVIHAIQHNSISLKVSPEMNEKDKETISKSLSVSKREYLAELSWSLLVVFVVTDVVPCSRSQRWRGCRCWWGATRSDPPVCCARTAPAPPPSCCASDRPLGSPILAPATFTHTEKQRWTRSFSL